MIFASNTAWGRSSTDVKLVLKILADVCNQNLIRSGSIEMLQIKAVINQIYICVYFTK